MKRLIIGFIAALCMTTAIANTDETPDQMARATASTITSLIKTNRETYARDYKKLYAMVDEHVLPHFDFRKMSQQVLGPAWRNASDQQRERFTKEFRDLLVRTYATALLKYNNEEIVFLPYRHGQDDRVALVKSQIRRTDGGPPIGINYNFYRTDSGWKVYDVAIEGPSIVTTYQRVYAQRLQKENLDQLIDNMGKENQRAVMAGPTAAAAAPLPTKTEAGK